jgi:hypothetical protein
MVTVVGRTEGHYDVLELPYGKDYVWCPGCVEVECDCGERLVLSRSRTGCRCGADHASLVGAELARRPAGEDSHPWRDEYREWCRGKGLHSEYYDWLELSSLD